MQHVSEQKIFLLFGQRAPDALGSAAASHIDGPPSAAGEGAESLENRRRRQACLATDALQWLPVHPQLHRTTAACVQVSDLFGGQ